MAFFIRNLFSYFSTKNLLTVKMSKKNEAPNIPNSCRFETIEKLNGSNDRSFNFLQIDCFFQ